VSEIEAADEAACKLDGMFRDIFNQDERRDLIYVIITASDAYRAEEKRKNCNHIRKIGGGGIGANMGTSYSFWHCQDCGASYDSRKPVLAAVSKQTTGGGSEV
jgi:hypothetical protein